RWMLELPEVGAVMQAVNDPDPKEAEAKQAAAFKTLCDYIEVRTARNQFQNDLMPQPAASRWREDAARRAGRSSMSVDRYWFPNDFRKEVLAKLLPEPSREVYWDFRSKTPVGVPGARTPGEIAHEQPAQRSATPSARGPSVPEPAAEAPA